LFPSSSLPTLKPSLPLQTFLSPQGSMATPTPDTEVPRLIMVDDTDPLIEYSPPTVFTQDLTGTLDKMGQGGPVYNSSLTGTSSNSSFSYKFNGTFVRVGLAVELEGVATNWDCTVDNQSIPAFQISDTQITNAFACDSGGMLAGTTEEHTLVVNFWFDQPNGSVSMIWLDSIQYQPLPSDPLDGVSVRVHNSDPSVTYNSAGAWEEAGAAGLPAVPGDTGTNVSFVNGAGLLVNFTFIGTHVSLFGVDFAHFNTNTASYDISYDTGASSTVFNLPELSGNSTSNCPLFNSLVLSPNQYNLGIVTNDNKTLGTQPLSISYFIVKTNSTNSDNTTTHSGLSPGLAAVIVICVVAILVVLGIGLSWQKKQQIRKQKHKPMAATVSHSRNTPSDGRRTRTDNAVDPHRHDHPAGAGGAFSQSHGFLMDRPTFINGPVQMHHYVQSDVPAGAQKANARRPRP